MSEGDRASGFWHPVAAAGAVDGGEDRLRAACLGEPLVIWRDATRRLHVFTDRCPHRGARLSLGRIDGASLECPYHGWRFGADGRCIAIPALPGFVPPEGHRACAWAVRVVEGLIWVADAGAEGSPPVPGDLPSRRVLCGPFDVATSAPRVVENFLDTAHFGLVHEGSLGDRTHLAVPDYRVDADAQGRPEVRHYRAWQPRASAASREGAWVDYRYRVLGPYAAVLDKRAEGDAPAEAYALWVCPLEPEASRVWFTIATSDTVRSDDELVAFQQMIFAQDRPILESQVPKRLPLSGTEVHSAADRLSAAYRRWLLAQGVTYGVC